MHHRLGEVGSTGVERPNAFMNGIAMIGQTISHYRILKKIGEGAMGVIYKAEDTRLGRIVALKFLPPSKSYEPVAKARFVLEAKAASALDHPNICTIFEIDETKDGEIFIVMAYYDGKNLDQILKERTLDQDEALDIMRQLSSGLAQAHAQGIVHQDINPRNILMLSDGTVKLVDFGVAKLSGKSSVISQDSTMGTMAYMAPEQIQAKGIDNTTDVWALGALFYELLSGRKAFGGAHPQAIMYAILYVEPAPIPHLADHLKEVLEQALQKNRRLRQQDAGEFLASLPGGVPEEVPTGSATTSGGSSQSRIRLSRPVWISAVAVLAVAIALGTYWLGSFRKVEFHKRDLLLITEFENKTGEEVFDGIVSQALAYDLGQSPHVSLFAGRRLSDALERMERDKGAHIDAELGRELAEREGVAVVLEGAIAKIDNTYQVGAYLVNPLTGETVSTKSATAADRDGVFAAIDQLSRNIRKNLGESLLSIDRRDKPLARVTTGSLQALRFYTLGEHHLRQADWEKAATFYQEAIAADSTFAIAYSKLGRIFFITARTSDALKFSAQAMDHRAKLSDREKYYIEAEYYRYRADYDRAIEKSILLLSDHEDDYDVKMNLATTYILSERYDSALAELQAAATLAQDNWYIHFALGNALAGLGRYDEAAEKFTNVLDNRPRMARTLDNLSWVRVCQEDFAGARALQDSLGATEDQPSVSLEYRQAKFHYFLGELDESLTSLGRALGEVRRTGDSSQELWILVYRGLAHQQAGRLAQAHDDFTAAVRLWPGANPRYFLGRVQVMMGDLESARDILSLLENPAGGELTHTDLGLAHRLRGLILFHRGQFKESAAETELSLKILPDFEPRLMLARAYLAMEKFKQAREALKPTIDFPFVAYLEGAGDVWPRALALWGQIAEAEGERVEAMEYYEKALNIWSRADESHREMRNMRIRLSDMILDGS